VGVRVRGLLWREALERKVVVRTCRDGNPPESRRAQLDQILRVGAKDPEVIQDLCQIPD